MATTYCDKCHFEWNTNETVIETLVLNETDDVRMRYFQCPECGAEYIVDITDKEIRKLISVYKKMQRKYARMYNAHESEVRLRNYIMRMDKVHNEIVERERVLKGRWARAE